MKLIGHNFFLAFLVVAFGVCFQGKDALAATVVQWTTGTNANNHYYYVTDNTMSWTDADTLATNMGGYLVAVNNQDEQDFINNTILTGPNQNDAFWTGLNDAATENTFVWTSGETFNYQNWGSGEPNDFTGGVAAGVGEDYVALNWQFANNVFGTKGQWNDVPNNGCTPNCTTTQPYRAIIELTTAPAVPIPAALWLMGSALAGLFGFSGLGRVKVRVD